MRSSTAAVSCVKGSKKSMDKTHNTESAGAWTVHLRPVLRQANTCCRGRSPFGSQNTSIDHIDATMQ
jgi:hypothetical protein